MRDEHGWLSFTADQLESPRGTMLGVFDVSARSLVHEASVSWYCV